MHDMAFYQYSIKNMKKLIIALAAAAAFSPVLAQAQQSYVGVNVGRAELKTEFAQFGNEETDTRYKVYGGYQFNPTFGVEAGHVWLGEVVTPLSGIINTSRARALYAAGTATFPVAPQFAVFGKLGVSHNRLKSGDLERSDNRPFAGIGASYAFTPAIAGVVEYEHFGKLNDDAFRAKANFLSVGLRATF